MQGEDSNPHIVLWEMRSVSRGGIWDPSFILETRGWSSSVLISLPDVSWIPNLNRDICGASLKKKSDETLFVKRGIQMQSEKFQAISILSQVVQYNTRFLKHNGFYVSNTPTDKSIYQGLVDIIVKLF